MSAMKAAAVTVMSLIFEVTVSDSSDGSDVTADESEKSGSLERIR